ncbi:MAG TPA: FlgD immunoglobulin-like domain containing protein [bacterium]
MRIFFILILGLVSAGFALAGVIQVEPGIDKISTAMTNANPGDTLLLAEGVYWETKTLNTIDGNLTIRGIDEAEVILYGPIVAEGDFIHVFGNLWLENLILVGSNKSRIGIINYHGGVETSGGEFTAEKNNLYINNCMSLVFVRDHIGQHAGSIWGEEPWEFPLADNKWHPYDTLRVTNCLFYGADISNNRAIFIGQRQARYIEVRSCTMWSLGQDGLEVNGAIVGDDVDNPQPGSDLLYVTTIADHLTIFNTYNKCPDQSIGRGGDGIHYEWSNRNQSMTNTIAFRTGRFCFKGKRGESELTAASYCMGDSANVSGDYNPPTIYYWTMKKGDGSREGNPYFNDPWNGDFSLNTSLSDAIGGADDGSNMGDPHWDDPSTYWPKKDDLHAIIEKAKTAYGTGVEKHSPGVVKHFELYQNYPNPFNPHTIISYSLEEPAFVTLTIYNISGQQVRILVNEVKGAGSHSVLWDGSNDDGQMMSNGVYLYKLKSDSRAEVRKMLFIK